MKYISIFFIILFLGCSSNKSIVQKEKSVEQKEKIFFSLKEYLLLDETKKDVGELTPSSGDLELLNRPFVLAKENWTPYTPIILKKEYKNLVDVFESEEGSFFKGKDIQRVIYSTNRVIVLSWHKTEPNERGDYCTGGTLTLYSLDGKIINHKILGSVGGEVAGVTVFEIERIK